MITATCFECGQLFGRKNSDFNKTKIKGWKHYCSSKCKHRAHAKDTVVYVRCKICGDVLKRYKKTMSQNGRYYCKKCRGTLENVCRVCGKKVRRSKYDARMYKAKFCSKECRAVGHRKNWVDLSRSMLKDHWCRIFGKHTLVCVRCGHDKIYNIELHHKKYVINGGDNTPDNLEPLCQNCHGTEHHINGIDRGEKTRSLKS